MANQLKIDTLIPDLIQVGREFSDRTWSLATSSNYSCRLSQGEILMTKSGVEKGVLTSSDFLTLDTDGQLLSGHGRPSAETRLHLLVYKTFPKVQAVLHTHSVFATRLSLKYQRQGHLTLSGYEMLKGLGDNETHEMSEVVPILPNHQDMTVIEKGLKPLLIDQQAIKGFLLAGHGLYTWGPSLRVAKRQVEAFEFLFKCQAYAELGL